MSKPTTAEARPLPKRARQYWDKGLTIIPQRLDPTDGKLPNVKLNPWWEAQPPLETVLTWHQRWPDAFWAFVTGTRWIVADFDVEKGGLETLARLGLEPTMHSLGGGAHVYFWAPDFVVRSLGQGIDGFPGMEILAWHHLCTFSGSDGARRYRPGENARIYHLEEAPGELQELVRSSGRRDRIRTPFELPEGFSDFVPASDLLEEALRQVEESGNRNTVGFDLALHMWHEHYSEDEILETVVQRYQPAVEAAGENPYTQGEATHTCLNIFGYERGVPRKLSLVHFPMTDLGNGERLVLRHGDDLRYCHPWKSWLVWDGKRWKKDDTAEVYRRAKDVTRQIKLAAADVTKDDLSTKLFNHGHKTEAAARQRAMVEKASSEADIIALPESFDTNRWLINLDNGTLDLRTGELHPHDRDDLLLKVTRVSYDPDAACPRWEAFLERILPDGDTRAFVKRAVGYSLTGEVGEQVMFLMFGTGANGKSTFIEVLRTILGPYAQQAPAELLLNQKRSSAAASPDVARLFGARFVSAVETEEGRWLAETLLKLLTGGDRITARFLYSDPFEFDPTHKFWLASNHLPAVRGTDEAIWRRILRIPFEVFIPKEDRDPKLLGKLRLERNGILRWAVEGCLEWQRAGLAPSQEVVEGTAEYRQEQDFFGSFLEARCILEGGAWTGTTLLYQQYEDWARESHLAIMSPDSFGKKLREREEGFVSRKRNGVRGWLGIRIRPSTPIAFDMIKGGGGGEES